MTIWIGIDPGINGAIAFLSDGQSAQSRVFDLPRHPYIHRLDGYALAALMRQHSPVDESVQVYLEAVHAIGGGSMQSMGSMMKSVGIITGAIDCTRFPLREIHPQGWKKFYRLGSDKSQSLEMARRLYPELQSDLKRQKDNDRAEAVLIAHWGRAVATGSYESQDEEAAVPF